MKQFFFRLLRFISQLLKSAWLFFPGMIFLLFAIFCFWMARQGKDILVAFTENTSRTIFSINYTRIIFFVAIGFWAYVSWYSARIISYIKKIRYIKKKTLHESKKLYMNRNLLILFYDRFRIQR